MFSSISDGGGEHVGVLERLVLALGDRQHHHLVRLAQIEGGRADEVADVLDHQHASRRPAPAGRARPTMAASRWQPLPVLIWIAGAPVARMRSASWLVCWSPSITATGSLPAQHLDGAHQQRGLARAGAGHQVERENAAVGEPGAVALREAVVLGQDVALDLDHARCAAGARSAAPCRSAGAAVLVRCTAVSMRARGRARALLVRVIVRRGVRVPSACAWHARARLRRGIVASATAGRAHATSPSSLDLQFHHPHAVPPVTCSW